jgi:ligand-binding sensor domain-containing protein
MDTGTQQVSNYESFFAIAGWDIAPDDSIWVSSKAGFIANISLETLQHGNYHDIEMIKVGGDERPYALVPERIEVDANGAVWVFVKDSGLYRYAGSEWKYFGMSNLPYPYVFSIDNQGTPSVGMCGKLLTHDGEKWIPYSQNCLNPSNMTITSTGAIWFADSCDGAYRFEEGEWTHFEKDDLGGMLVNRIIEAPDGAIWFFGYGKWIRYQE